MPGPYSPYSSSPARTRGPDLNVGDAISMGAENVRNYLFGAPLPEGVTNAQVWIEGAPNEEERARRMALVAGGEAPGLQETDPAFFATAASNPPPGSAPGDTMSAMSEGQLAAVLPATQEPERLSSDPDSPPQLSYHTPKPPPSDPMGELLEESKALRASIDGITAETQGRLDTSAAALKKNYEQQLANLTATEAKINTALAEQTKTITDFEAARAKLDTVQQEAAADATARVQAINDEIQNYKIDPNRAFRSTWQVVGAAIASAAGAYAQGISPNRIPNTAMAIINKAIDRDIHAQQMELGKLKTQADIQNNVYARMLQQHGDQRRAHAEARIAAITVAELKVKQIQSTAKSSNQKLAIQGVLQKLAYDKEVSLAETKTKAMNSKARMIASEMEFLSKGLGGSAKGAVSGDKITARLVNILPLFDKMKVEFDAITMADWAAHTSRLGQQIPALGPGAARVQDYIQTRTMITKEIVSIFEGSKPSDLDWKVMVKLFPVAREAKTYALPAIEHMRQILITRVGKLAAMSPEQREKTTWGFGEAMLNHPDIGKRLRSAGVLGVSNEDVADAKALAGWKDQD